jgi:guanylate kinase
MRAPCKVSGTSARNGSRGESGPASVQPRVYRSENNINLGSLSIGSKGNKLVLFLGPTAAGKSTVIRQLASLDPRFKYVAPFTTRQLRPGETEKVSVSAAQLDVMEEAGQLLARNQLYGHEYGTPRNGIEQSLRAGCFPCLDWPIQQLHIIAAAFPGRIFRIYIVPPSLAILHQRLEADGRDSTGDRFIQARTELNAFWSGSYNGLIDLVVINSDGQVPQIAESLRAALIAEST